MITIDTVFILGAGASKPYEYPTGKELRLDIYSNSVEQINKFKQVTTYRIKDLLFETSKFTETFFNSSVPSIDLFLARNPHFSDVGKLSIVLSILEAEKKSKFRENISDINQDWYSYLFHRLTEELNTPDSYNDIVTKTVSFITFNYDRSLEYFLYESLSNSFSSVPEDRIINKLKQIPVYHVYGVIDKLPWQGGSTAYRKGKNLAAVMKMKDNIKIIHERDKQPSRELEVILKNAKRIFFLGFGYAKENLEILGIPNLINIDDKQIYGTAFGLFDKEIDEIRRDLSEKYRKNPLYRNPRIENCDCLTLLRKYL